MSLSNIERDVQKRINEVKSSFETAKKNIVSSKVSPFFFCIQVNKITLHKPIETEFNLKENKERERKKRTEKRTKKRTKTRTKTRTAPKVGHL